MPIKGLSEQRRIPRIGKIHLGVKVEHATRKGVLYPKATEYFVVPQEVAAVHGEKPTELPIMIPVEDEEYWASQYYRAYSQTRGLTCKGDGENCRRMVDTKTGDMAGQNSGKVEWKEMSCDGKECIHYQREQCREVMNLQFLLPQVPGLGVWQIDTSSVNSIRNINSSAELIRGIIGRIRMIPLVLSLEKQEVVNPDDGKKKIVYVLNLRHGETLQNLITDSIKPIMELLAPIPDDETEPPMDIEPPAMIEEHPENAEKDIEKYWGEQKAIPEATKSISSLPKEESSSIPFKNIGEVLAKATKLAKEKGVSFTSKELCDYEGVKGTMAITDFDRAWQSAQEIIGQKLL